MANHFAWTKNVSGTQTNALQKFWADLKLMFALIKDYGKGNYREVPWRIIASLGAAVIYFVSPIDLVPDFIPFAGFIDDAFMLKLVLDLAAKDLQKYAVWQTEKANV